MNFSLASRFARVAVIFGLGLLLVACSSQLNGRYRNRSGSFGVEFNSGKAFVSIPGARVPASYKVDGKKVILQNNRMGVLILARNQDGTLTGPYPAGVLRKVGANSAAFTPASYGQGEESDAAAGGLIALLGGSILFVVFIIVAIYVYFAVAISTIAKKTNHENRWMAWVPILNVILLLNIASRPVWWILLCLIPFVNIVIMVIIWMGVAKARNKPDWWGVLIIVPIINFILPGVLAFTD